MTTLATDPLTLVHLAISLAAIAIGLVVLAAMLKGQTVVSLTGLFLGLTVLTSVTGYFFHNEHVTPGMIVGAVSLIILAVALFALYGQHLAGRWRAIYVITAVAALYLNCFVLVVQSFIKIPPLHALVPAIPPAGPVFGAVQGLVLLAFVVAGWRAVKAGRTAA
jgi:hypothetical protein